MIGWRRAGAACLALLHAMPWAAECPKFETGVETGRIQSAELNEISGLAASRQAPGVLWAHNDSGDQPAVYAIDSCGKTLGAFALEGAAAREWEDIAIGPGPEPDRDYLYIGDIGDNNRKHDSIRVYRVPEPAIDSGAHPPLSGVLSNVETITLKYPKSPYDSEALFIDPSIGDLYLATKDWGFELAIHIFRAEAPLADGETRTLSQAARIPYVGMITAADISPDGALIGLRPYFGGVLLWPRAPGSALADALKEPFCLGPLASEPQGEAFCFAGDGQAYYTTSEGANPPLYRYRREGAETQTAGAWPAYR